MNSLFTTLDWAVFAIYFSIIAYTGWHFSRVKITSTKDYFLGGNSMPMWVVAVSVLATSQSAATFLGGPDSSYRGDLTYLATNIGGIMGALFVAWVLIPRFYQNKVSTVYELLKVRFGEKTKQRAGMMYLVGRVFASGSRLYMAAIAVSMILFTNISPSSVISSVVILVAVGLAYTYMGGIRSVIWSDLIQLVVYVGAAIAVIIYLLGQIPADMGQIIQALNNPGGEQASKLTLFDFSLDFSPAGTFSFWACITGFVLLNIGAFGLDQDMTQRVLTCKDAKQGSKAMINSIIFSIPVVLIFMTIGLLLYIFYQRPELMGTDGQEVVQSFNGESVTIFMYYVLNEMPAGLRGLVTVGVVAAALSTLNSGLNSMSSVAIQDIYKPWKEARDGTQNDLHYVKAGRFGMAAAAIALGSMGILCFYWQQYTDMPLLAFALSVMVFAYTGLLGVYFTAIFTNRGGERSVAMALIAGFLTTLLLQAYVWDSVMTVVYPDWVGVRLAFPYQLCVGTFVSLCVCLMGSSQKQEQDQLQSA
ncbi:sodium:solute symporter [Photobacterium sanctipauli]|uniref:Sodium:solute symporter n=1 Tax=Photobacterium sanctipauli TaxID=1342794 RepID=A0A2T3NN33_9GAMM|nr:sodium:solute symporter [Photobacterium sanctipauli]PSW16924.1 sodium:solute symporter [Photobacterium sanctipauli]